MYKENKEYLKIVQDSIRTIAANENIHEAAKLIAAAYKQGNKVFTFGTGHSHILGEELYARAGGWDYIIPILSSELTLSDHPFKSTFIERIAAYADVLLALYPIAKNDVIIITSNSGRNSLIVEMALRAKKVDAKIIVITSLQHSSVIKSRHKSKLLLKDIGNIIIDNLTPAGDTTVLIKNQKMGPISTLTGVFIGHQLIISALKILSKENINFQTFISSNLDNQDERNMKLLSKK